MENLTQLIYVSSELVDYDENRLIELLTLARKKNERHNITGLLLYQDGCFMQVIEGSEKDIDQLSANIKNDKTHTGILCLVKHPIENRDFPEWSMAECRGDPAWCTFSVMHERGAAL